MEAQQELKKAGLKVTLPRLKILEILTHRQQKRHLSAEDIYKILLEQGEEIGLATVYRVLTQFESVGLVTRHYFDGTLALFELNRGEHHDHIICVQCGRIEEFVDDVIEEHQRAIAEDRGFRITSHSLIIYGECLNPECPYREP